MKPRATGILANQIKTAILDVHPFPCYVYRLLGWPELAPASRFCIGMMAISAAPPVLHMNRNQERVMSVFFTPEQARYIEQTHRPFSDREIKRKKLRYRSLIALGLFLLVGGILGFATSPPWESTDTYNLELFVLGISLGVIGFVDRRSFTDQHTIRNLDPCRISFTRLFNQDGSIAHRIALWRREQGLILHNSDRPESFESDAWKMNDRTWVEVSISLTDAEPIIIGRSGEFRLNQTHWQLSCVTIPPDRYVTEPMIYIGPGYEDRGRIIASVWEVMDLIAALSHADRHPDTLTPATAPMKLADWFTTLKRSFDKLVSLRDGLEDAERELDRTADGLEQSLSALVRLEREIRETTRFVHSREGRRVRMHLIQTILSFRDQHHDWPSLPRFPGEENMGVFREELDTYLTETQEIDRSDAEDSSEALGARPEASTDAATGR